jgi:hypothetical protein
MTAKIQVSITVDTRLVNHGRLRRPISVRCEYPNRGEVVAVFEQAGIAMSGDSVEDAINGLIVEILDAFEDYSAEEANLGPGPRQQLHVLREYVNDGVEEARRAEYSLQVGAIHRHQFERPRQGTGPIAWPTRDQFRYTPRQQILAGPYPPRAWTIRFGGAATCSMPNVEGAIPETA